MAPGRYFVGQGLLTAAGLGSARSAEGIGIERESPGQNMWLYDLWLIERLLESIENRAYR
jgi:hypothetical protein